jgi:hypothetical protein
MNLSLCSRVALATLVRFLVVKLTYSILNLRFDMDVVFMSNYFFSGKRRHHQDALGDRFYESQAESVFQMCS